MLTLFEGIRISNMIECDSYTINQYNEYSSRYDATYSLSTMMKISSKFSPLKTMDTLIIMFLR